MTSGFYSYYKPSRALVIMIVKNERYFRIEYSQELLKEMLNHGISPLDYFYHKMGDYKRKEYDKHRRTNKTSSKVSK